MKQLQQALVRALVKTDKGLAVKQILRAHAKATRADDRRELLELLQRVEK